MQYVDSSALVKRYVREADSDVALRLLAADLEWVTAEHTMVEVRRTLAVRFAGDPSGATRAREVFDADWSALHVVALDDETCSRAAELAETTGARTLDALHLAAALRAGAPALRLVTFDLRLAQAARGMGWSVVGG